VAGLLILSIETSTGCGSISLTSGSVATGKILAEYTHRPEVTHSRRLLGSIDHVMKLSGLTWDMLDGVAVSIGPGSFTGLRIGMAAAKGITMAAGLPLVGIPTLDGLAQQCSMVTKQICPVLDARKKQIYAAFYKANKGGSGQLDKESIEESITPQALIEKIDEPTLIAGPGSEIYKEILCQNQYVELMPASLIQPRAVLIGFLAAEKLQQGAELEPPSAIIPMYARASEAEINAIAKKKHRSS
jgi:tRNA threonylcarbamoyladenosine biosynthesis protein TsaB